jgi:hypothetical protein
MSLSNEQLKQEKLKISQMSYQELLQIWRFAKSGDIRLQGELGNYFADIMNFKKAELSVDEQVRISKLIGWDN